ncbi:hypothetical protein SUGI_1029480 [Cryptomeria japonica]|nr:hypothetical protein SUGI_1029480 [Cryptomeria japonica]
MHINMKERNIEVQPNQHHWDNLHAELRQPISTIVFGIQQQWKGAQNHFHTHLSNCINQFHKKIQVPNVVQGLGLASGRYWHTQLKKTFETVGNGLKAGKEKITEGIRLGSEGNTWNAGRERFIEAVRMGSQGNALKVGKENFSNHLEPRHLFDLAMCAEEVSKRLDGIPVYTVSNSANEFVLVSDMNYQRSIGLFCFRKEDAESLLFQVSRKEPGLGNGAKVVAVSLNKVYELRKQGLTLRFLPDPHQVKNALEAASKAGVPGQSFPGVPVFQSDHLIIRSKDKRFRPLFFSKEDLESSLSQASQQQKGLYPSLEINTDIQVGSFEDVIKKMENSEDSSGWEDIVFIPPGLDIAFGVPEAHC